MPLVFSIFSYNLDINERIFSVATADVITAQRLWEADRSFMVA